MQTVIKHLPIHDEVSGMEELNKRNPARGGERLVNFALGAVAGALLAAAVFLFWKF